jgi:hypothetical protein
MKEDHEFCDTCPGCRPAILDMKKGTPFPEDHPVTQAVNKVWDNETTYEQRKAYIAVTWKNSQKPDDLRLSKEVLDKIQTALESVPHKSEGPR